MEEQNPVIQTTDFLKKYVNLKIDIILLNISSKLSNAAAYFIFILILGFLFLFISLFLSLSLATWLANELNMPGMGNMIVSLIYIIMAAILIIFREKLILGPIRKKMSTDLDMSDLNESSSIRKHESIDEAIDHLNNELNYTEESIDQNIAEIRDYYSFDQLKDRFIQSIYDNPKSILNTLLIIRELLKSRKKKK